jgi:hypothetical protein
VYTDYSKYYRLSQLMEQSTPENINLVLLIILRMPSILGSPLGYAIKGIWESHITSIVMGGKLEA